MEQLIALPAKIRRWLIQLYLAYNSDNKLIIYLYKKRVFVKYVQRKGLGLLWAKSEKTSKVSCISRTLIIEFPISVAHTQPNNRLVLLLLSRYNAEPPVSNVGRKCNSRKLSKTYIICYQIAPRCVSRTKLRNRNKMHSQKCTTT